MNTRTAFKWAGGTAMLALLIVSCGSSSPSGTAAPQTTPSTHKGAEHDHADGASADEAGESHEHGMGQHHMSGASADEVGESHEHSMHHQHMAMHETQGGAANGFDGMPEPGTIAHCPVLNNDFEVTADSPHSEYKGKTYVFCCSDCKGKFDADPAKYVTE